jgi:hypothetical protein
MTKDFVVKFLKSAKEYSFLDRVCLLRPDGLA